jgi:hypothetical protein
MTKRKSEYVVEQPKINFTYQINTKYPYYSNSDYLTSPAEEK